MGCVLPSWGLSSRQESAGWLRAEHDTGISGQSFLWPFQLENLEPLTLVLLIPTFQAIICCFPIFCFSYWSALLNHIPTQTFPLLCLSNPNFIVQLHRSQTHLALPGPPERASGPACLSRLTFTEDLLSSCVPAAWVAVADVTLLGCPSTSKLTPTAASPEPRPTSSTAV